MKHKQVFIREQKIDHLFNQISKFQGDPELEAHWARYLCVLVSGYIECALFEIYCEYAKNKAHKCITNFVQKHLKRFQNPKMEKILFLVGSFDENWMEEVKKKTDGELKDAVDSIVNNRNQIAHGRDIDITYGRLKDYYGKAKRVIGIIENQCYR